jgi:hypothetical protein
MSKKSVSHTKKNIHNLDIFAEGEKNIKTNG